MVLIVVQREDEFPLICKELHVNEKITGDLSIAEIS